jgi:hypothetical protein
MGQKPRFQVERDTSGPNTQTKTRMMPPPTSTSRIPALFWAGIRVCWNWRLALGLAALLWAPGASGWADTANTQAVVTAANAFLATLSTSQKTAIDATSSNTNTSALYNSKLANVEVWSNVPVSASTRNGLQFASLTAAQLNAALAVANAALSSNGTTLLEEVRLADQYISGEVTNAKGTTNSMWGYKKYYIAFVGAPSTTAPWTLQLGGHHIAYNITYNGTYTSGTPMFAGNEPNSWTYNGTTHAPLGVQRNALVSLRSALGTTALLSGTYSDVVFGPNGTGNHDTVQPKSYPTSGRGQLYSTLTETQKALAKTFIESWVNTQTSSIASELLAIYESPASLAETYVGYAGSSATLSASGSYFRVDGPRLWIEFIVQGGVYDQSGVHDHGVFRDKLTDYGAAYGSTTVATTIRPPTISMQPVSQTVNSSGNATFSVIATGTPSTLTYQWYKDSTAISGAAASTYTVSSASSINAGAYSVIVSNTAGNTASASATLTVNAATAPSITAQPASQTVTVGESVTFSVAATGTAPLTYQWYKDSAAISGAASASYTLATTTSASAGSYHVVVSNSAGLAASSAATLTMQEPFSVYLSNNGFSGATANGDSDNDGISNLFEFMLGGNPKAADPGILPTVSVNAGGALVFSFHVASNLGSATWAVESTSNFSTWTTAVHGQNGVTITSVAASSSINLITVTLSNAGSGTFLRLRATLP